MKNCSLLTCPRSLSALSLSLALMLGCAGAPADVTAKSNEVTAKATKKATHKAAHKGASHRKPKKKAPNPRLKQDTVGEFANFGQWNEVAQFIDRMVVKHQFKRDDLEAVIKQVHYIETSIQLIKPAPSGHPKNWHNYRKLFVEPVRINGGARFWDEHAAALARAETQYGVPAEIIVAILGVETVYGRNTGNFRVMDVITTLSFAYPDTPTREARTAFFRGELENTLLFARESAIDPFTLQGSYAGAIGLPQFMPSSIRQYAVDFDGDGKIDLRNSPVDAIGSIAHFLVLHGWQPGEPIAFPATVWPGDNNGKPNFTSMIGQGLEARFSIEQLNAAGVTVTNQLPASMKFGLVDLQNGTQADEYWLGTQNFFAITQYNRSFFYAMSVLDLSHAIRTAHAENIK
jgi:membrane-bound lytic murein transglycosylase B